MPTPEILVSFVIPTLNAARVLPACLQSINIQTIKKIEIIIIDGGSNDNTLSIAKKYNAQILNNPLKTGESGKAVGVKAAKGKYIALIDSDNILPSSHWLSLMLSPLASNPSLIGSEPWEYTYRPGGGFIERYSALTGVNDPYCLTAGNFDRRSFLNSHWTNLPLKITDYPDYQLAQLPPHTLLPTIGANGTIFRTDFIKKYFKGDYFFDIDMIESALNQTKKPLLFAKVKIGIIHTFCESSVKKFYNKQLRRATDLYNYQILRNYSLTRNNLLPTLKFIFYIITFIPILWDTIRGFVKKPDSAWLFHPPACIITLYTYTLATLKYHLHLLQPINRNSWQQ